MTVQTNHYTSDIIKKLFDTATFSVSVETQELTEMLLDITTASIGVLSVSAAITTAEVIIDACSKNFSQMNAEQKAEWAKGINDKLKKEALPKMLVAGIFGILSTIAPWMIAIYAAITGVKVMNQALTLLIKTLRERKESNSALQLANALEVLQTAMNYVLNHYANTFKKYIGNATRKAHSVTSAVIKQGMAVIAQLWNDMITKPLEKTQMSIHQVMAEGPPKASKELMNILGLAVTIGALGVTAAMAAAGIASIGASGAAAGGTVIAAEGAVAGTAVLLGAGGSAATTGGSALLLSNPLGWTVLATSGIGWWGWRRYQDSIVMLPIIN